MDTTWMDTLNHAIATAATSGQPATIKVPTENQRAIGETVARQRCKGTSCDPAQIAFVVDENVTAAVLILAEQPDSLVAEAPTRRLSAPGSASDGAVVGRATVAGQTLPAAGRFALGDRLDPGDGFLYLQ